jgi:hypothetical protein
MEGCIVAQHLLYGLKGSRIAEASEFLGVRLGCNFQERESEYLGIYMLASTSSAEIKIVHQPDPEGDPLEDDFVDYGTLVYVEARHDFPELDGVQIASERLTRLRVGQ